ncbi:MAG: tRNA pseudouridine(38-40) synthase TruA [Lachnospiraceae bacterium]|nr:tRNA pseudouridine(38-40) synthase TruA [Lachnospiraceae bacterium]
MKRVKLTVAYDGTNFCGWQTQVNGNAVQDVLNRHLCDLLGEDVKTMGASRTDSGVHARGNVAVFDTDARIPVEKICFALNARLPEDIRVLRSEEVDGAFHPRFTQTVKTYEYCIWNDVFADPMHRLYAMHAYGNLDDRAMDRAAQYLLGEHDFVSFCSAGNQTLTTVRTIFEIGVRREGCLVTMRIRGNGFLYNMVRIIAGTLIEVGQGKCSAECVEGILTACDRSQAGPTAVAKGLTLVGIKYPEWEGGRIRL